MKKRKNSESISDSGGVFYNDSQALVTSDFKINDPMGSSRLRGATKENCQESE